MFEFLFWLFLIGIFIASVTDLKRREVDNWLNLFLIFSSWGFVGFAAIFNKDINIFVLASLSFVTMFFLMNLFYYGRVFAGGDSKLLFSMFAVFIGASAMETLSNIGIFVFILLAAGSLWGIGFSLFLFFKNFEKTKKEFKKQFNKYFILVGILIFFLSYFNFVFVIFAFLFLAFPFLFALGKSVENVVMIHEIKGKDLREGDWLVSDVKVKQKVIKADWDGLSEDDLILLKNKRKVKIRDGVPFVPGFFIGFLFYYFFGDWLIGILAVI